MKRIANDVAVQTLLYTMNPQQKVGILDADERIAPYSDPINKHVVDVYAVDKLLHDYQLDKVVKAKIRKVEIHNELLYIRVDTLTEPY